MLNGLKTLIQRRKTTSQLEQLPAIRIARAAINANWLNAENKKIFPKRVLDTHALAMMNGAIEVATSETPRLANRRKMADYVYDYARTTVLSLEPAPAEDPTGLRGQPGITGELKTHLLAVIHKDELIRNYMDQSGIPHEWDSSWATVTLLHRGYHAYAHVFQSIRLAYDDAKEEDDWFRPFVAASCGWAEHLFRQELGLPLVFNDSDGRGNIRALWYSTFSNRVKGGENDPLASWRADLAEFEQDDGRDPASEIAKLQAWMRLSES